MEPYRKNPCVVAKLTFSVWVGHRFESQHILHYISEQNVPKWVALAEGAGGALGWLTTNERKEAMWYAF